MRNLTFSIDFSYCPEGHRWIFLPSSTYYSDIFYCEKCDCFYYPTVKKKTKEELNKEFYTDRAKDLIDMAKIKNWKETLSMKDYQQYQQDTITNK